jgi:glycosyltransferase involved in cell wall biosynthesis
MVLSIGVLTYNHVFFIRQCLESILTQRVSFDYEIVVGDDASTDGTKEILQQYQRNYPDKFVLLLGDDNQGISANYKRVLQNCHGKYIALCEGDDYWTAKDKLQKQVDFLESHPEYGFVGAYSQLLFPDGEIKEDKYDYMSKPIIENGWELYGDVFEYAKSGPVTRTVSLCFRRFIIEPFMQYEGLGNDLVLQTVLAKHSWFAKYERPMTMYRQGGVSTSRNDFEKRLYYNDWYVNNRLLQKKLFPVDCNWNEDELMDSGDYIRLQQAISEWDWRRSLGLKRILRTDVYKKKKFSKYLLGPLSCFLLWIIQKCYVS